MGKSRKVCLFVVEGIADKTSLALPLQNLFRHIFDPAHVEFDIMNGDITADSNFAHGKHPVCLDKSA